MTLPHPAPLRTVIGRYPHTEALLRGAVTPAHVVLDLVEVKPTNRAFAPMVRELAFDVCEMAIVTYLQARAHGRPLVLLPAVMLGRFQHHCMLYRGDRGPFGPGDLPGRRIGVRAYGQTTAVWLRGILQNDYGVDPAAIRWVTFEDAHVAECADPSGVERASGDMTEMLLSGDLDAAIYGAALPDDARLASVIPDPHAAARAWHSLHGVVPVNHLVVVTRTLAETRPDAVREVYAALAAAKQAAPPPAHELDLAPFGIEANRPALDMIVRFAHQQGLIPDRPSADDLFADFTRLMQ